MTSRRQRRPIGLRVAVGVWMAVGGAQLLAAQGLEITFGEVLSDFAGPVRVGEARVAIDAANHEVLVGVARDIHVFDQSGMKVFGFQIGSYLGAIRDLAVLPTGDILALAYDQTAPGDKPRFVLARHNYRGEVLGELTPTGVPPEFTGLYPNRMVGRGGRIVLASLSQHLAIEIGADGSFRRGWDLAKLVGIAPDEREDVQLTGFAVDGEGNLLVTCAVQFRAYWISADGSAVRPWGKGGSQAGTFGNAAGITVDGKGQIFVADKMRKVVLAFDANLGFLTEFGQDPSQSGRLGRPSDVFSDGAGRLYVTQIGNVGVFAYDVRESSR